MRILGALFAIALIAAVMYYGVPYLEKQGFVFPWRKYSAAGTGKGGSSSAPKSK